ncbi:phosphate transporter family protein [Propionibacterium acidifaciens F0233]|uniref:Phosphate transporter n=1 Tax=Propionibacterium acidifaciens F0233 TaxID=553198 RepID=U2QIE4_9ACTN|nr:inorganic phosphate transporter [Propionibacterium acidifaciens]AYW77550.1 inorganic phosphate transporter [Propionibacterium acidifaciens]ERK55959.1 phosphate transporter family protein [Propionibacterium acidifaciens F0233]
MTLAIVVIVVVTALVFDFTNGFHDSSNSMATAVATGAFRPRIAVTVAAVLNIVGACLSTEVARTISSGIVNDALVTPTMVFAGLAGAIIWNLVTWLLGLPSSSSHAMFGGLIGAVLVTAGHSGVHWGVIVSKIILPALVAPAVAGVAAGVATFCAYRITDHSVTHAGRYYRMGQRISSSMLALAHGTSDGQKTMGIITLVLIAAGMQAPGTHPHWWVIGMAGLAIGLGTYSGGWRIMRTMGSGLVAVEAPQGFCAETASTVAVLASSHLGFGLSTTHVCTGSILGSGVGRGAKVNWSVAGQMASAWLATLPCAAVVGAVAGWLAGRGIVGIGVVAVALVIAAGAILTRANRTKVHHGNVNDDPRAVPSPARQPGGRVVEDLPVVVEGSVAHEAERVLKSAAGRAPGGDDDPRPGQHLAGSGVAS